MVLTKHVRTLTFTASRILSSTHTSDSEQDTARRSQHCFARHQAPVATPTTDSWSKPPQDATVGDNYKPDSSTLIRSTEASSTPPSEQQQQGAPSVATSRPTHRPQSARHPSTSKQSRDYCWTSMQCSAQRVPGSQAPQL